MFFLTISNQGNKFTGFTLVELLVAVAISGTVMSVAGLGLVSILQANKKAEDQTERRMELNRALDYIADDIREARTVQNGAGYTISSPSPDCAVATPVMDLTVPNTTKKIVYYINDISGCDEDDTVWLEPGVIKRVDDVTGTTIAGTDGNELIDAIPVPDSVPSCSNGSRTGTKGFYACIPSDRRSITLYLYGKLTDSSTTNPSCGINTQVPYYCVTTKVFARSASP
jgi:prepilin-type N-terminal cleavage/methylation domain-containing protein